MTGQLRLFYPYSTEPTTAAVLASAKSGQKFG